MSNPLFNGGEMGVIQHFGHPPDQDYDEAQLARRVLEMPAISNPGWFIASAVTLAAAYLRANAALEKAEKERNDALEAAQASYDEMIEALQAHDSPNQSIVEQPK